MKNYLLIISLVLMFANVTIAQTDSKETSQLTEKQKLEDFDYLFNTLKDSYPYFGVLERENDIKWLDYEEKFKDAVRKTKNDKEFIKVISQILGSLHSGHTDLSPTYARDYYTAVYKNMSRKRWLETLQKGNDYWPELLGQKSNSKRSKAKQKYNKKGLECIILDQDNIAVLKIKSFDTFQMKKDVKRINKFLKKVENYPHLIIDIQDNGGGNSRYWSDYIVPELSSVNNALTSYYAIRNSDFLKSYFDDIKWDKTDYSALKELNNLPPEVNEKDYFIASDIDTIFGEQTNKFAGKIYLLVNRNVYSSAEGFAVFCKSTKWATVVGETTAGDGVGIDPVIAILPNSKILFRFPGEMGLNPDGSSNEEMNTTPDIKIDASNSEHRLYKLAQTINPKIEYVHHDLPPILNDCKADILIYPTKESSDSLNEYVMNYTLKVNKSFLHLPDSMLIADTTALKMDLKNYHITCYGSYNGNLWTKKYIKDIPIEITPTYIKTNKKFVGKNISLITSWFNNKSEGYYVRYYTAQSSLGMLNINSINHGMTNYAIANPSHKVLQYGNFIFKDGEYLVKTK